MIHKILAAVDGSEHSAKAVEYAGDIALKYDGELFLIYVISKAEIPEDFLKYAKVEKIDETPESLLFSMVADGVLKDAEKQARTMGVKVIHKIVKQGNPADEISKTEEYYIIGINGGTESIRVGLFDLKGKLILVRSQSYRTYFPQSGWAKQNPDEWWQALYSAMTN